MKKTVKKPVKTQKKPVKTCKPCKPCKQQQHIYHHIHHHGGKGENIGNFSLSDIKNAMGSIKEKIVGHKEPEQPQPVFRPRSRRQYKEIPSVRPESPPTPIRYKRMVAPPTLSQQVPQPAPQPQRAPTLTDQWTRAVIGVGDTVKTKAAEAITPQGAYTIAKGVGRGVKWAGNQAYKGMEWLDKERILAEEERETRKGQRLAEWYALRPETRREILEERALRDQYKQKIRDARQQALEYQLDRTDAYLSGRKFTPKVFKVESSGLFGETTEKYLDEYGREVPGVPEEVRPKRSSRPRSEAQEIGNIFGFKSGGPVRSPLYEPPPQRQLMGADEGDYDMPRRRVRYSSEPPQYSQPLQRRIESGVSPRREADDVRRLLMQ